MLGDLQIAVMEVIWELGDATVAEVHQVLLRERSIAYTTVLTTLRALERRGFLSHQVEGKAHRFFAKVSRGDYTQDSVERLVARLFAGDPAELMSHLLGAQQLNLEDLERIRGLIEEEGGA